MSVYNPNVSEDAAFDYNDEGQWSGFKPTLSIFKKSLATLSIPPRATGTLKQRAATGILGVGAGAEIKIPLVKGFGTDDYTGKGNGGEHRYKARIQHSIPNLKLIEDIAEIEIYALAEANDGEKLFFGNTNFPAKIERSSIKGTKGELTGEGGGRYIEFEIVTFPYSAYLYNPA